MKYREILEKNKINIKEIGSVNDFFRKPKELFNAQKRNVGIEDSVFEVLMNPIVRRGDGLLFQDTQNDYIEKMTSYIHKDRPIKIVFLGFPFKCHNPIETLRKTPDLGELGFLLRLLDINETVKQVYPAGVSFNILLEGSSYADFFGANTGEVELFENQLKHFVKKLEAKYTINFTNFAAVCSKFPEFENIRYKEEVRIRQFDKSDNQEVSGLIDVMTRSLPVLENIPISDLLQVYDHFKGKESTLNDYQKQLKEYLYLGAEDLAISYLAFQKAKNKLDVIPKSFPNQLYFSTTTKPTRYSFHPIHRKTRMFPHHGVPLLTTDKIDVCYLKDVLQNPEIYSAVFCKDDIEDAPFYYLKGKQYIKKSL